MTYFLVRYTLDENNALKGCAEEYREIKSHHITSLTLLPVDARDAQEITIDKKDLCKEPEVQLKSTCIYEIDRTPITVTYWCTKETLHKRTRHALMQMRKHLTERQTAIRNRYIKLETAQTMKGIKL